MSQTPSGRQPTRRDFIKAGATIGMAATCLGFSDLRSAMAQSIDSRKPLAIPRNIAVHLHEVLNDPRLYRAAVTAAKTDLKKYAYQHFTLLPEEKEYFEKQYVVDKPKWVGIVDQLDGRIREYRSREMNKPIMEPKVVFEGDGAPCPDDGVGIVADEVGVYFCFSFCCISICVPLT